MKKWSQIFVSGIGSAQTESEEKVILVSENDLFLTLKDQGSISRTFLEQFAHVQGEERHEQMGVCRKLKTISLCTAGGGNSIYSHINQAEEHNFLNQNEDGIRKPTSCLFTNPFQGFFWQSDFGKNCKTKKEEEDTR